MRKKRKKQKWINERKGKSRRKKSHACNREYVGAFCVVLWSRSEGFLLVSHSLSFAKNSARDLFAYWLSCSLLPSSEIKLLRCCLGRSQEKEKIGSVMAARGRRTASDLALFSSVVRSAYTDVCRGKYRCWMYKQFIYA